MAKDLKISKRRRLTDLYVRGIEHVIDDGNGGPVAVWIQKLVPYEVKQAAEKANAVRARIVALKFADDQQEARLSLLSRMESDGMISDRQEMIEFLEAEKLLEMHRSHEAELAEEDEWAKNGYFDGLYDSWVEGGMRERYALDPETDEEARAVFEALERFDNEVERRMVGERKSIAREYAGKSDKALRELVLDRVIDMEADMEWSQEYQFWELFFSVRDAEDHRDRYFRDIEEVKTLPEEVYKSLVLAINELHVDQIEGKD